MAKDINGHESGWSDALNVYMQRKKVKYENDWFRFIDCFPLIQRIFYILT